MLTTGDTSWSPKCCFVFFFFLHSIDKKFNSLPFSTKILQFFTCNSLLLESCHVFKLWRAQILQVMLLSTSDQQTETADECLQSPSQWANLTKTATLLNVQLTSFCQWFNSVQLFCLASLLFIRLIVRRSISSLLNQTPFWKQVFYCWVIVFHSKHCSCIRVCFLIHFICRESAHKSCTQWHLWLTCGEVFDPLCWRPEATDLLCYCWLFFGEVTTI